MVIAQRVRKWKGDERMEEFLRPATLFNRTNFWQYHGEIEPETSDQLSLTTTGE
jgi:hypothetical protein